MDLVRTRVRGRDHSEFGERIHGELRETEKKPPRCSCIPVDSSKGFFNVHCLFVKVRVR